MDEPLIPWNRVAAFVRQHTHDVRNGLNCLDLETELLADIVTDSEASESIVRIQKSFRSVSGQMRTLANLFQNPQPIIATIPASSLLRIWHEKLAVFPQVLQVEWIEDLGDEEVSADVDMMTHLFHELLGNAIHFSPNAKLTASALRKEGKVIFELCEPKSEPVEPKEWGCPLVTTKRGGYGMGLWTAKRNMESINATFSQRFDPDRSCLLSEVTLVVI